MTLSILGWVYFFCFLLGLGYTFISMFLSHHGHAGAHANHDFSQAVSHSHHPVHETDDAVHIPEDSGQPDFPLFSPLTLALSVTIFGGVGTILNFLKIPNFVSLPASGIAGLIGWVGSFYFWLNTECCIARRITGLGRFLGFVFDVTPTKVGAQSGR